MSAHWATHSGFTPTPVVEAVSTKTYRLRWTSGQTVLRQHTFTSPPLGAVACTLEHEGSCLVVLEADRVNIYAQDGAVYSVALARRARAMWPLRRGLVLEPDHTPQPGLQPDAKQPAPLLLLERALNEPQPRIACGSDSSSRPSEPERAAPPVGGQPP